jgi:hypothetical protein
LLLRSPWGSSGDPKPRRSLGHLLGAAASAKQTAVWKHSGELGKSVAV